MTTEITWKFRLLLCICFFVFDASAQTDTSLTLKREPELVSKQFSFTEGPAVDKKGNVFFTDQPNNKIWKYGVDGKLSVFMENTGRSNGMTFDRKGNLISCADEHNQLWSIDKKKRIKVLFKDLNGHRLNGPNDVWVDRKGGIYFTDPYYHRNYWDRKTADSAIGGERVYYLPKGKTQPLVVDQTITKPNGIVGTPDGKTLYVSDIGARKIYKYAIGKNGVLQDRVLFTEDLCDGMTLDDRGNLYIAGNGVTVYNPTGKKIQQIKVPARWTANMCFGGKNRDILFITASESVFILPMRVKGVE